MAPQMAYSELLAVEGKIYHLGISPDQLAKNIFVVGDPARADIVAAHFDTVVHRAHNREYVIRTGTYKGMPVSVIATGIGTDNVEIALIEAFGLNEFDLRTYERKEKTEPLTIIRIGTSGGLQDYIDVGTLAISAYAIGVDNTGLYYNNSIPDDNCKKIEDEAYHLITEATPKDKRFHGKIHPYASKASPEVVEALKRSIGEGYAIGITATASGFFGPQGRNIPGLDITIPGIQETLGSIDINGDKVINFEMESSLLFHLSRQLGYRSGTVCPIIDNRPTDTFLA